MAPVEHIISSMTAVFILLVIDGGSMTPIINVETLQVYDNLSECAKSLQTSATSIHRALKYGRKVKHFQLEYLQDWLQWEPEVKEKFCIWGNVGFY